MLIEIDKASVISRSIRDNTKRGFIVMGDFNGHLSLLEKDRTEDENGKNILKWMDKFDLLLMNADMKCRGLYTWGRQGQKSAIDMVLVNKEVYDCCSSMIVDEGCYEVGFSDHNMVTLELRLREGGGVRFGRKSDRGKAEYRECVRNDEPLVDNFLEALKLKWGDDMDFIEMWDGLVDTQ